MLGGAQDLDHLSPKSLGRFFGHTSEVRANFLQFAPPLIGEEEIAEVVDSLRTNWLTSGPKVERFESEFARLVDAEAALALNSCTAAMHVALATLGIGPGASVASTDMTFCSSIHVIEHVGARPILLDVEPDTLNLDPNRLEEALAREPSLKALLPVHLYGHPCDMDPLLELCATHRLALIEDAAHALPAGYRGRAVGSDPAAFAPGVEGLTAFSFYATKNLTTGEGGMLTGPRRLIEEAQVWSLHGMSRDAYTRYTANGSWHYDVVRAGFKYNMADLQAALGLQQLRRLPEMQGRRKALADVYLEGFGGRDDLQLPAYRAEVDHAWHIFPIRLRLDALSIDRGRFIDELRARNIGSSVHFIPVHRHTYYREKYGLRPEQFPVAEDAYQRLVSLPMSPALSAEDGWDVVAAVTDVLHTHRR